MWPSVEPRFDTSVAILNASSIAQIETPLSYNRFIVPDLPPLRFSSRPARTPKTAHDKSSASFGVVYVNEIARHAMLDLQKPQFPVGSVIVREKLKNSSDVAPQLLAVMVKREHGFNPKADDWEFLLVNGSASAISLRQKTGECRSCHASQKQSDFVFRTYLPEAIRRKQN